VSDVRDRCELYVERPPGAVAVREDWTPSDEYLGHYNLGTIVEERTEDLINALRDIDAAEPA
jgi:hypothetical protein